MESLLARDNGLSLNSESDALEVLSSGLRACIFYPQDLHPEFFDLSNQIAGNVLQKLIARKPPGQEAEDKCCHNSSY